MLLRFNKDKEVWELVKVMKIKMEIRLELEDFLEEESIKEVKEKYHLKTDEEVLNYFKEKLFEAEDDIASGLCVEKAKVKEVINISMEKEKEDEKKDNG